ncbi:MAG: TonB-dependent receptor [Chitinophagaceae bacterium BSSC1]|nr:MAG: TonB-dependent receptor [Chitinophagaceae bacterium BSSC1]
MRKLFTLIVALISFQFIQAQFPMGGGAGRGAGGAQSMNVGHFYGKIVDSKTNKAVEGVTVQLTGNKFDTVTKKMKEAILATQITRANGEFSIENLSVMGSFKLKLSSLGYKSIEKTISFGLKMPTGAPTAASMQQMLGQADKDLGNLKIEADATNLGNVTVTSTAKPQFEMGIDRKVFNVDKNLMAAGQTATEIMKNIPSLNVDIDGNVTLRNASPTIFIDNRPTTLTLDQIPADIIDKVELITNPSAKYDASGGNAGILNIVLKKNKKNGYNGGIRAGIDSRAKINLGGDINLRQTKTNISLSGNYNQRKSISEGLADRNNLLTTPSYIHQTTDGVNENRFSFFRGSVDYLASNRSTFTIGANYVTGKFDNDQDQRVDSTIKGTFTSYNMIKSLSTSQFENWGTQLSYKYNFPKNGENISADFNLNSSNNENNTSINTQTYNVDNSIKGLPLKQKTIGGGDSKNYTMQVDYENEITLDSKLEFGARAAIRDFKNSSDQYRFLVNDYYLVPSISNKYKFNDQVYAAYGNYAFKVKKWSYQLGFRIESSSYTGTLLKQSGADSSSFSVKYPLSLFPSAFVTYKVDDKQDLQLNYSRRVNRPNFFQLMPFPDFSDPQNINIGNANLKPEFTNSFEVSYNNAYTKGANFLATAYFKYSTNLITRYVYRDKNGLTLNDSAYFNTYINADNSVTYGLELSNKMPVNKWWDLTLSFNLFSSKINATIPDQSVDNELVSWFAKMNSTFKLAKGLSLQFSGDYQAKTILPPGGGGSGGGRGGMGGGMMFGGGPQSTSQGYNYPRYAFDLAIRKEWTWKNGKSGSLSLSMNDIFRTQLYKTYSESIYFNQVSSRRRDPQILRLNFSYRFGKFDATLFKRKNTKADQGGGMDMMQQ